MSSYYYDLDDPQYKAYYDQCAKDYEYYEQGRLQNQKDVEAYHKEKKRRMDNEQ